MNLRAFIGAAALAACLAGSAGAQEAGLIPDASGAGVRALKTELEASRRAYGALQGYSALFRKQERGDAGLDPEEQIYLRFEKPFKIFMKWLNTHKSGLQVMYERGKHDNKLAIHKPGLLFGLAQVVFLPQDSPYVREGSKAYDIEDAGLGTFITDFSAACEKAAAEGKLKASLEDTPEGRRADVTFDVPGEDDVFFCRRAVVTFDKASRLPVRQVLYDWQGVETGIYAYENVRPDPPADDPEFIRQIHRRLFRVWRGDESRPSKNRRRP